MTIVEGIISLRPWKRRQVHLYDSYMTGDVVPR